MALVQISILASLAVLIHCNVVMYDLNLVPHECLEHRAIAADYEPLGEIINVDGLPIYESPPGANKKRMVICVYDIYGLNYPNLKQVTDQMAVQNGGFRAILPDFHRGDSWFDGRDPTERPEWIERVGDWDTVVKPDLINIVQYYRNLGVEEFAIFGMCWGGKVSTLAATELNDLFKASGLVHPSSVLNDEAYGVKIPMFLMPSDAEPDMLPFYAVLYEKFGFNSGHRRFTDMSHGFSGARGNFSDPLIRDRVNEVISKLGTFFDHNLNETTADGSTIQPCYLFIMLVMSSLFIISQR